MVGEIGAGQAQLLALSPGTAVKIMTGAPVPAGADAVVPYEWTDRGVGRRCGSRQAPDGRASTSGRAGEDVAEGDLLLEEGTVARAAPARPARRGRPRHRCRPGRGRGSW